MKITIINGNARHGSTWHCANTLTNEIARQEKTQITEFFLPKDMPYFCKGCFSCIVNGEDKCPHAASIVPILAAIRQADIVVLTSPVYGMDVSGQMKALLDHLCYMWMSHRPDPAMFNKIGVTISTTAGAGLGHTTKTMVNSLKFWGFKRIYSMKNAVGAMKWSDITDKKQVRIKKQAESMAKRIVHDINNIDRIFNPLFRSFFFRMMAGMMKKNTWNPHDRKHWEERGWLDGTKPF